MCEKTNIAGSSPTHIPHNVTAAGLMAAALRREADTTPTAPIVDHEPLTPTAAAIMAARRRTAA